MQILVTLFFNEDIVQNFLIYHMLTNGGLWSLTSASKIQLHFIVTIFKKYLLYQNFLVNDVVCMFICYKGNILFVISLH